MKYDEKVIGKIIRTEREKRNLTQANLGKRINVTGKQISNYEKGELFPPMSALLSLCEEFDCELGYLLGEEEYADGSKIMTKVTELTGLNKETIDNLRKITGTEKSCLQFGYNSKEYKSILNDFLSTESFLYLIECIQEFSECYFGAKNVFLNLEQELGTELYEKTFAYYISEEDYFNELCEIKLEDEVYEAKKKFDKAFEELKKKEHLIKVYRYDVKEEFERLINELYPK